MSRGERLRRGGSKGELHHWGKREWRESATHVRGEENKHLAKAHQAVAACLCVYVCSCVYTQHETDLCLRRASHPVCVWASSLGYGLLWRIIKNTVPTFLRARRRRRIQNECWRKIIKFYQFEHWISALYFFLWLKCILGWNCCSWIIYVGSKHRRYLHHVLIYSWESYFTCFITAALDGCVIHNQAVLCINYIPPLSYFVICSAGAIRVHLQDLHTGNFFFSISDTAAISVSCISVAVFAVIGNRDRGDGFVKDVRCWVFLLK